MAITINGTGILTGVSVGGLPDGIVDTDMLAANAVTSAKATGRGITMTDSWRITSNFTSDAIPITSNWERADTSPWEGKLGTGLTESSGIFTFPSTGWYFITWKHFLYHNAISDWNDMTPEFSNDSGVNYTAMDHSSSTLFRSGTNYIKNCDTKIIDITNVSTQRMRWRVDVDNNSVTTMGNSTKTHTGFDIFKLGDT